MQPYARPRLKDEVLDESAANEGHDLNLLFVDDDPFALDAQVHIAGEALPGCRITAIDNPLDVLAVCSSGAFDCVLLDYNMPELDGLTVAHQLREQHPYLPVVLCTGAGDELLATKALQGGITDYIPKSAIRPPALRRTVLHAITIAKNARIIDEQRSELEGFAFALAHDFKQPLRQITTFANLALQDMDGGELEDARQHLSYLTGSARRLSALVDMMSQYTLLNKPLEPELVRVGSIIDGVLDSLGSYIKERNGDVETEGDAFIVGNGVFLHQILQNLIVNGFKYNGSSRPRIVMSTTSDGPTCNIAVSDNGIGIGLEYIEQVFQPLARLHTSTEYSGTGLGLTMARKAAAAQGGAIVCTSQLGVGSQFVVSLPLALSPSEVAA